MRTIIRLLLSATAALAQDIPITRLAGASFKVADLEKARQFYTGNLGLEEAFDLKDSSGAIQSVFYKVNDDQYLEFSPGAAEEPCWRSAGSLRDSPPNQPIDMAGSQQTEHRGKALGVLRVSDHPQHIGLASDNEAASMALYRDKLDFRELFRGGPTPGEIRWIDLAAPGTTSDILELMIMTSQPAQGRRHIAFEVPDIKRTEFASSLWENRSPTKPGLAPARPW